MGNSLQKSDVLFGSDLHVQGNHIPVSAYHFHHFQSVGSSESLRNRMTLLTEWLEH